MWMEAAVARYGRGNFRWIAMVGDLSAMYDEIDPVLACEMTQEAVGNLPRWTGGRRRAFVNMTHAGGQVQWGKSNRDSRLTVDLEQLMQMARFDCENTLYKFQGKANRRKFGVPMGGFMSPGLAVIALSIMETKMEPGPELVGGMVRYMDDVLGLYAVSTGTEEEQSNKYFERVAVSYPPPLVLNVEEKSNTLRFLELVITIDADKLSCRLWNSVARDTVGGNTVLTRLPMLIGGTNKVGRLSWVVGAIHRVIQGCYGDDDIVWSLLELRLELAVSGWCDGLLRTAVTKVEQSIVGKGKEWQQKARLLYEVWVALKLGPETPGGP